MVAALALLFALQVPDYDGEGTKAGLELPEIRCCRGVSFSKAIAADPKDYYAHFSLAMAYTFLHKDEESVAEYRKTLEVKPGLYEAELNPGILLRCARKTPPTLMPLLEDASNCGKPERVRAAFLSVGGAIANRARGAGGGELPAGGGGLIQIGGGGVGMGPGLGAERETGRGCSAFPGCGGARPCYRDTLLSLAELYEEKKQTAEALAIYKEFPDNPAVQEHAGRLLADNQKFDEAVRQFEQVT